MKILLVTTGFLPDGKGGVELSLARFCRWARTEGHELLIFRRLDLPEEEEFSLHSSDYQGTPVVGVNYRFGDATSFRHLVHNDTLRQRFEGVFREFAPDVVHVHHLTCLTTDLVDVVKESGVPLVLSLHDYWMGCPRGQRIMGDLSYCPEIEVERCTRCYRETWPHWFSERDAAEEHRVFGAYHARIREVLEMADALLVPSPFARRVFHRYGLAEERMEVLEYGMDPEPYQGVARSHSPSLFRVGYLGTLLPSKGVHILVDAFQRIGGSDCSLDLHGPLLPFHQDHAYGERLERLIQGWESQVTLHGAYEPEETPNILAGLDVLVVPSLWYETYCMVIREGFLAGVPVVASNFGAMSEAIEDGRTGLLFRVGDSVDLAEKLDSLARDPGLRQRLASAEKSVSSTQEHGRRTVAVYERLLHGRT